MKRSIRNTLAAFGAAAALTGGAVGANEYKEHRAEVAAANVAAMEQSMKPTAVNLARIAIAKSIGERPAFTKDGDANRVQLTHSKEDYKLNVSESIVVTLGQSATGALDPTKVTSVEVKRTVGVPQGQEDGYTGIHSNTLAAPNSLLNEAENGTWFGESVDYSPSNPDSMKTVLDTVSQFKTDEDYRPTTPVVTGAFVAQDTYKQFNDVLGAK
jgi:hypothetical protein